MEGFIPGTHKLEPVVMAEEGREQGTRFTSGHGPALSLQAGRSALTLPQTAFLSSAIPGTAPYLPELSMAGGGSVVLKA